MIHVGQLVADLGELFDRLQPVSGEAARLSHGAPETGQPVAGGSRAVSREGGERVVERRYECFAEVGSLAERRPLVELANRLAERVGRRSFAGPVTLE